MRTANVIALLMVLLVVACGGDAPPKEENADSNAATTRDRDTAVRLTAARVCGYYVECGTLDDVGYASVTECESDWQDRFYDSWSADECTDDIDPEAFGECHQEIDALDCDSSGIEALGVLLGPCREDQVCD